jgi:3-oxoacyl-[acyl-carrier protein] reductase
MTLEGKVALVTGAARGMGEAEVRRLRADGAAVVAADILDGDGKRLADSLGDRVRYLHLDVASEEQWQAAVEQTEREFGRLDVLVNNAGILRFNAITDTSLEEFRQVIDVNLVGVFLGMKTAIPAMRRAGGGSIVNISSVSGQYGGPRTAHYAASKAGLISLAQVIARFGAQYNVRSNTIAAGLIASDMAAAGMAAASVQKAAESIVLKRLGTPQDVADAAVFLASDASSYITAQTINVNGGLYF